MLYAFDAQTLATLWNSRRTLPATKLARGGGSHIRPSPTGRFSW
jgi:hypothetical protein